MAGLILVIFYATVCIVVTPPWGCHAQQQTVTVTTPMGNISGRVTVVLDRNVNQFLGVPYAQPPVNDLRFRKPQPIAPWYQRTLEANQFGPSCPQPGGGANNAEDCLYLNIYVRANDTVTSTMTGLKPVMIWIHGGGFVVGAGRGSDGSLMAVRGGVVVVTINYRLGMLGWLSTLDQESPGNYGLWDQKLAIEWVRHNIAAFGGDPNQITIFGESGGGYSVGLLAVSPLTGGLFQRAIMESGTALNRRTIHLDPRGFARRFAESLGCLRQTNEGYDSRFLITCARQRSVNDILSATSAASNRNDVAWTLDVAPVIDGELIPTDVRTLLVDPQYRARIPFWSIDVMAGTTNAEGSLVTSPLIPFQRQLSFNMVNGIPTRVLCSNVSFALARDYFQGSPQVDQAICQQYTSRQGDADQAREVVDLYGDMMFVAPAVETLLLHSNASLPDVQSNQLPQRRRNSYQYLFAHTPWSQGGPYQWFRGAGHGAEVNFVFGMFMADQNEARLSLAMMDGWTNFAKFGDPNDPQNPAPGFQWPRYDPATRAYTNLDLEVTSQTDVYGDRMRFWLQRIPDMNTEAGRPTPAPLGVSTGSGNFPVTGSRPPTWTGPGTRSPTWGGFGTDTSTGNWGNAGGETGGNNSNSGVGALARPAGFLLLLFSVVKCFVPILFGVLFAAK